MGAILLKHERLGVVSGIYPHCLILTKLTNNRGCKGLNRILLTLLRIFSLMISGLKIWPLKAVMVGAVGAIYQKINGLHHL